MKPTDLRYLAAALVLASAVACRPGDGAPQAAPAALAGTRERSAVVEERVEPALEWSSGQVASARHSALSARVLARIEEVRVRAGSAVGEDELLVVLDARDLQARVRESEEALRSARARLELARSEHARAEALFREGAAPRQQLDQRASELRSAQAAAQGLEEALSAARTALSYTELRSPVAGRVVDRLAEPGDMAVPGQPLLRIYDPGLLRIEVPVRESLAIGLGVDQPLQVEVPAAGRSFEGFIDERVPFAEPGARTLLIKVRLPGAGEALFAGMFARVAIPAGPLRRLVLPAQAVERIGQLEFVTVVDGERSARRLVTTGRALPDGALEILSGLRAGERVRLPGAPAT
jgi:RND family efflux transporter MFP subunit